MNQLIKRFNDVEKLENVLCRLFKWKSIGVFPPRKMISIEERKYVQTRVVKLVQQEIGKDLEDSCSVSARKDPGGGKNKTNGKEAKEGKKLVTGRFRQLSSFCDTDGIWRVSYRSREFTMFTKDRLPAILLPRESRYTMLKMKQAHEVGHSGVTRTVLEFRARGWWTVQASRLAKSLRAKCVICQY